NLDRDQDPLDFALKVETPEPPDPPKTVTAEDKELDTLGEEAERLQQAFSKEWAGSPDVVRQVDLYRRKGPPNLLGDRCLAFAAAHPDHPAAIDALGYVFQAALGAGDPEARIAKAREQAIDLVIERYLANPEIVRFFSGLQYGVPAPKGGPLLRSALA